MGWLNAVPEKMKRSRISAYIDTGADIPLPELHEAAYIAALFHQTGVSIESSVGSSPLPWTELESWIRLSGLSLNYWELLTLKEMSYAYVSELSVAKDAKRLPPYVERQREKDPNLDSKLKNIFQSMNKKRKG